MGGEHKGSSERERNVSTVAITTAARLKAILRGGRVQVGQSHVRCVLRRRQFIHGRNETVGVLLHVVQEAEHADVGADAHAELRLRVAVVLRAVLFLLEEEGEEMCQQRPGGLGCVCVGGRSVLVTSGYESSQLQR